MKEHTVEDLFKIKILTEVTLSPNSKHLVYVSANYHKEYKGIIESQIILQDLGSGNEEVLSEEGCSVSSPSFSPDSSRVSFISSEKKGNYLTIHDIPTGSSEQIREKGKLVAAKWKDDGSLVLLREDYDKDFEKKKKNGDDGYFFEENHKFQSLWNYIPGRGMSRITSGVQIWDFALEGERAVAITSDFPYNWSWYNGRVSLIDMKSGKLEAVYVPEKRQLSHPRITPEEKKVLFIESLMSDNGVESGDIISLDLKTKETMNLTGQLEKSFSCFDSVPGGNIFALANNMGTFEIISIPDGKVLWSRHGTVTPAFSPKFSRTGETFALAFTSRDNPMEVLLIEKEGKDRKITDRNEHLKELKKYDSKLVKWKSTDGLEIYGIYRSAGKGRPLVVNVHGGPTSSSTEQYIDLNTLFLGQGFSVFMPNYRGSTGKGRKYAEMNRGDMGGMDFSDIMSGLEHLIQTEDIDKKRLYITGGSYGGFMSAWAITQTDKFKASVSLFGISDWISFHGVSSLADWDSIHYDQDPYKLDRFVKFSPIRYLDQVKTPILMMHGIEDPYVPVGQYLQFYRALKDKKKEARLLLFPREGHGFREKKHVETYLAEAVKYFNSFS